MLSLLLGMIGVERDGRSVDGTYKPVEMLVAAHAENLTQFCVSLRDTGERQNKASDNV